MCVLQVQLLARRRGGPAPSQVARAREMSPSAEQLTSRSPQRWGVSPKTPEPAVGGEGEKAQRGQWHGEKPSREKAEQRQAQNKRRWMEAGGKENRK